MLTAQNIDARMIALAIFAAAGVTIAGAWTMQALGFTPCELCLAQRYAYYLSAPLALGAYLAAPANARAARFLFALIALAFAANAVLAAYHSGVEFHWWPGPAGCTGAYQGAADMKDFMKQLQNVRVVRCDEVQIRIFGFSMANANVFISAGLAVVAAFGARIATRRPA